MESIAAKPNIPIKRRRLYDISGHRAENARAALPRSYFILAAVICALFIPFVIMDGVRKDLAAAEWWTLTVAQNWEEVIGAITSWLPVSVFELMLTVLIGVGVFLLARFFINLYGGRFLAILKGALCLGVGAAYVLNLYMLSMGFGYYRARLPMVAAGEEYTAAQAAAVTEYYLDDYNALAERLPRDKNGCVVCPYSLTELSDMIAAEYDRIDFMDGYLFPYTPEAKPITNSWVLSGLCITGITFLPTGEANINVDAPPTGIPYTLAHELAHTKGVQREGDANLLAQYVLLNSEDDYLRYCGLYNAFANLRYAIYLAGDKDTFADIGRKMSQKPIVERRFAGEFWSKQPDLISKAGEFFNDLYLQLNGAVNGTGSYSDGSASSSVPVIDPTTGEQVRDPVTDEPVFTPMYSSLQKMFFYMYERDVGKPNV